MELENDLQLVNEQNGGIMGMTGAESMRQEITGMQTEIRQIENKMEKMQGDFTTNETIF